MQSCRVASCRVNARPHFHSSFSDLCDFFLTFPGSSDRANLHHPSPVRCAVWECQLLCYRSRDRPSRLCRLPGRCRCDRDLSNGRRQKDRCAAAFEHGFAVTVDVGSGDCFGTTDTNVIGAVGALATGIEGGEEIEIVGVTNDERLRSNRC